MGWLTLLKLPGIWKWIKDHWPVILGALFIAFLVYLGWLGVKIYEDVKVAEYNRGVADAQKACEIEKTTEIIKSVKVRREVEDETKKLSDPAIVELLGSHGWLRD